MLRFLALGLMLSTGAALFAGSADAASRYCFNNPDDPNCEDDDRYLGPRYGGGYGDDDDDDYGYGDDDEPAFAPPPGPTFSGSRCERARYRLERNGYRRLRAIDCTGPTFAFRGSYRGDRVRVRVRSDGRIISVRPY